MAIVDHVSWRELDRLVEAHQRNREAHTPVISLFRWWARRPHAVMGAILDAAIAEFDSESFVVADPFSGGGTVAFEAVRRGLPAYAQELYPWPSLGLAVCLGQADTKTFGDAGAGLLRRLESHRRQYWREDKGIRWEITHILRVRIASCLLCQSRIYLFREPLISLASRKAEEKHGFFGCVACGAVRRCALNIESFKCDYCGWSCPTKESRETSRKPQAKCPHCQAENDLRSVLSANPTWAAVLVQERQVSRSHFPVVLRPVQDGDPIEDINEQTSKVLIQVSILPGLETNHLLRSGFRHWSDLYTHRQIEAILAALEEVNKLRAPSAIKARLQLSILGACEMPGYLCRWERYHPKALEAIANHRYARATVVVETNLLSPTGRGTIPRRLEAAKKAMSWMVDNSIPSRTRHAHAIARRRTLTSGALIVTGSSERQLLKDGVVRLVLTDPPYHDDVQYGELARLFHFWMHQVCGIPSPSEVSEAVPNKARRTDTKHYEQMMAVCLVESRRTLAKNGRLVLTYHNKSTEAWTALANALRRAEFVVVGLATVSTENAVDHSKRNKETFLCDLVIECVPRPSKHVSETQLPIRGQCDTLERQNLLAMGQALAEWVNTDRPDDLTVLYTKYLGEMRGARAVIR